MSCFHSRVTLTLCIVAAGTVACHCTYANHEPTRDVPNVLEIPELALEKGNEEDVDEFKEPLMAPDEEDSPSGARKKGATMKRLQSTLNGTANTRLNLPNELWTTVQKISPKSAHDNAPMRLWIRKKYAPKAEAVPIEALTSALVKRIRGSQEKDEGDPAGGKQTEAIIANILRYCRTHYRPTEACPQLAALRRFGLPADNAYPRR
ncbi:hypothetical protein TGMAS_297280 [Toxoplasma gondii MAS]|uniref:Transmembrane protein n=2 Tax=Toxoplasma gondii TaxID=5811 RepID=A0A086PW24_TOXGO|nr:hypothetical protein TGMAS_297280 [Toxoplasma gondii MAS]PUA84698.1 hypothetical protein TGBR9_297280 [Toxoplasma gondii TgCATBr9]